MSKNMLGVKENPFTGLNFFSILSDWERYYWEIFGLKTDFSDINIPEADNEFFWLICRPENFFAERACSGGKQLYPKWKGTDESLDDVLNMSFGRDGKTESYIIRVRPNWEADEDLRYLSVDRIVKKGINTLCFTERLLLGDFLYWKHKKHLDIKSITLCSHSRFSGGGVPCVSWSEEDSEMKVNWCEFGLTHVFLRARAAVS